MPTSDSAVLRLVASAFAAIPIGFGINAFVRPDHALSFFEFEVPTSPAERNLVNSLMVIYGARDIFMGVALFSALLFGHPKSVGWIMIATSAVAYVDGFVCWTHGRGEWNHWGYAPILTVIGTLFLGLFDRR
ncbi:hypothetical protein BDV26DRAFT_263223 [Aspergillus bertholletiae]|uniref:Integral membrane protein n=1 Tax=Aspergillus bertholletiae TaxID=1226010 RepID=A0A5N7B705_9EURO|nr:hypothetical protein BDV26DRAFT_263223 [Aspergillus bertholletiae]